MVLCSSTMISRGWGAWYCCSSVRFALFRVLLVLCFFFQDWLCCYSIVCVVYELVAGVGLRVCFFVCAYRCFGSLCLAGWFSGFLFRILGCMVQIWVLGFVVGFVVC